MQGFTDYHNFKSPLEQLVAYTIGPGNYEWVARGSNLDELGPRTTTFFVPLTTSMTISRRRNPNGGHNFYGIGLQDRAAQDLARMAANGNPMAEYLMQFVDQPAKETQMTMQIRRFMGLPKFLRWKLTF